MTKTIFLLVALLGTVSVLGKEKQKFLLQDALLETVP
jgi:hypothetical protein